MGYIMFICRLKLFSNQQGRNYGKNMIFLKLEKATLDYCTEKRAIVKFCRLSKNTHKNKTNDGGNKKNIEIGRVYLSTSDTSDILIEFAIVPSDRMVNDSFYSQVNPAYDVVEKLL